MRDSPLHLTVIALALVILLVIALKALSNRGSPLYGGLPSGHAAVAFGGWVAVTFAIGDYRHAVLISTLVFVMALLVAADSGRGRRSHAARGAAGRASGCGGDGRRVPGLQLTAAFIVTEL